MLTAAEDDAPVAGATAAAVVAPKAISETVSVPEIYETCPGCDPNTEGVESHRPSMSEFRSLRKKNADPQNRLNFRTVRKSLRDGFKREVQN